MIGCGTHRVFVQERGGGTRLAEVRWDSLNYGRRLDDMSAASVTVGAAGLADEECCGILAELTAWEHEVAIYRDSEEAWVGVVLEPEYLSDSVTIPGRDLFQWFERRSLAYDRTFAGEDLADIFASHVADALARDPSPNISVSPTATGIIGDRTVVGAARTRAADAMRELARSGVDFTMKGRTMLVGGEEVPVDAIGIITTDVLDAPKLVPRGLSAASEVTLIGRKPASAAEPVVVTVGGVDPAIGLVELVATEATIEDAASLGAAAQSRLDMLLEPPEYLSGRLLATAPFDFDDLVPGARVEARVRVGCRDAIGAFRLAAVAVDASVRDDGAQEETVGITLIPLGTTEA